MNQSDKIIHDGGPAFPVPEVFSTWENMNGDQSSVEPVSHVGMSLLHFYAAAAFTGLLARGMTHEVAAVEAIEAGAKMLDVLQRKGLEL